MDEEYDVVICGTGLKECILGGLLSVHGERLVAGSIWGRSVGKKVLQLDRNPYYGGECASLNLTSLFQKFAPNQQPPASYGANREWNVDLVPKFVMGGGKLVKILLITKVTKYLEWQVVDSSSVYQLSPAGLFANESWMIHKVPATETEALKSPLMNFMEKYRCKDFLEFCVKWKRDDLETYRKFEKGTPMEKVFEYYKLSPKIIDFLGHALALYPHDGYLREPFEPTLEKMQLYMTSLARYEKSPFIYPLYGLSTLPESFSRLSAVHGGTFMLDKDIAGFEYDELGKVCGVRSKDNEVAKCRAVICDPSYCLGTGKIAKAGQILRCICILEHLPSVLGDTSSAQIIIPQNQINRYHDIYIVVLSSKHGVTPEGKYLAIISTQVETSVPEKEIEVAFKILGKPAYRFFSVTDMYVPADPDGTKDNVFVTSSLDATSHFESATEEVLKIWNDMNGSPLNLDADLVHLDLGELA